MFPKPCDYSSRLWGCCLHLRRAFNISRLLKTYFWFHRAGLLESAQKFPSGELRPKVKNPFSVPKALFLFKQALGSCLHLRRALNIIRLLKKFFWFHAAGLLESAQKLPSGALRPKVKNPVSVPKALCLFKQALGSCLHLRRPLNIIRLLDKNLFDVTKPPY